MSESVGNLLGDSFIERDLLGAIDATHDLPEPLPRQMPPHLMTEVIDMTDQANRQAGRRMSYGATLAWGITIGVLAERARMARLQRAV